LFVRKTRHQQIEFENIGATARYRINLGEAGLKTGNHHDQSQASNKVFHGFQDFESIEESFFLWTPDLLFRVGSWADEAVLLNSYILDAIKPGVWQSSE
jgi:hypothetical protein